ncbi:hypothetical protein [Streptomyces sp. NPDC086023]|uniref:hypothetical protein n=1 Tax=Streptomyces sp. NPDC086023 TaxID=3365746 RepID=UPI0037D94FFB
MDTHSEARPSLPLTAPAGAAYDAEVPAPRTAGEDGGQSTGNSGPGHVTETSERGSFCTARCSCGWRGPARRSRDLARKDAAAHVGRPL